MSELSIFVPRSHHILPFLLQAKLDILVNPLKTIADYRTHITGVSKKDLEGVTSSLVDVQVYCL